MAPKKKKDRQTNVEQPVDAIKFVDATFYELTINDLNGKIAHLRAHKESIDESNLQLETQMRSLQEDRTDVTAYLDRTLQEKNITIRDMEIKTAQFSEERTAENTEFRRQLREQDLRYKQMQDELSSEIKLLTGKLNTLEEFREHRDELMTKFEQQQDTLRKQTDEHNAMIFDLERKQIIDKDRMQREVESRLVELSNEFAKTNENRIAMHGQRLARENISLNNEMDRMMITQRRMQARYDEMEAERRQRRATVHSVLRDQAHLVRVNDTRLRIIERLTDEIEQLQQRTVGLNEARQLQADADGRSAVAAQRLAGLQRRVQQLEQQLHAERTETMHHRTLSRQQTAELERFVKIVQRLQFSIRSTMRVDSDSDASLDAFRESQRKGLLHEMLELLQEVQDAPPGVVSLETIGSVGELQCTDAVTWSSSKGHQPMVGRSRISIRQLMAEMELECNEERADELLDSGKKSQESSRIIDLNSGSSLILTESSSMGGCGLDENDERATDEDAYVSESE